MQSDILSLQEISPNLWQAKYQERGLDAGFEIGARARLLVEPEQRLHIAGRRRFAVRLRGQTRQDLGGARRFFRPCRGPAREDAAAAHGI